ncbi:hypothetical protein QCA50_017800 [Cerrena zonata]|uniref:Uncharacterized protein n=1 Tax=Cerrena zonata TaxID=2478898 RepID=A0AAW0FG57_9APHY
MLHLIWQKDNSSTSEYRKEIKGVRSRLLECYRSLYFGPIPDMEPKQQVNRIAKNMIECVCVLFTISRLADIITGKRTKATLAELTSLEEMMRIMMEDGQVHLGVIGKMWQVYSSERPLSRVQRQGVIIILGQRGPSCQSVSKFS